jgi:FSR family fosmidomycin resistance protein-like MFS transporter
MSDKKPSYLNKSLLLISLSHAVADLSVGALPILLPFFKSAFALTYTQVGFIVLIQNLTSSVIQPIFGYFSDRLALSWLVPAGLLLAGVGTAVTGLAPSYPALLAIVTITGLGVATFHPQAAKSVYAVSNLYSRGRSMAIYSLGGNLGQACGSVFMMALLALPGSISNTLYFCLPAIVLAALLWRNLHQMSPRPLASRVAEKEIRVNAPILYTKVIILMIYIFLRSSIAAGLVNYIPLYFVDYLGGNPVYAGYLITGYMLSGVVGTYTGGALGDRFGRKTVILASMALTLPLLALFRSASVFWTFPLLVAIGFTYIASFSSTIVLAQEMMPGYEALAASLTLGFSIGLGGIAVVLLGHVADHFGIASVFTVIAVIPILAFCCAFFLPGQLFQPDDVAAINSK